MIKQVDRYVGKAALLGIIAVWSVMILLAMMFNLLGELRSTAGGYSALDAMWFSLMITPRSAYQLFPMCALMGSLVGIGGLAAANELVAFRTSGISRLRIASAALAGTLLVAIPVMAMAEWLAPEAEQRARAFRLSELIGQYVIGGPTGMWLRDGERIVNMRQPLMTLEEGEQRVQFRDVLIYDFGAGGSLSSITHSGRASHGAGSWLLHNVRRTDFGRDEVRQDFVAEQGWDTRLEPELIGAAVNRPAYMSMSTLWQQVRYLGENGLDDRMYRSTLFSKLFYPLTVLALVLAGMPFVFGSSRNQRLGVRLFVGMTLGVTFTIVNRAVQNLGEAYALSPAMTVLGPSLLLAIAAVLVLRRAA